MILSFATVLGCQGVFYNYYKTSDDGIYIADVEFDKAEAAPILEDNSRNTAKVNAAAAKKLELYQNAIELYKEAIIKDTEGIYTQHAHHQIATIYRRLYQFDQAIEHYQTIIKLGKKRYYIDLAEEQIENIRKNRKITKEQLAIYEDSMTIHSKTPSDETSDAAANALYQVAQAYEELEDFHGAIRTYQTFVERFPKHNKAPQAQFQIGNIYFYDLFDYTKDGGWGAFVGVVEKYPGTPEAEKTVALIKKTGQLLRDIYDLRSDIRSFKRKIPPNTAARSILGGFHIPLTKKELEWHIIQSYSQIGVKWIEMHNYPRAIQTYRKIIAEYPQMVYYTGIKYKKLGVLEALDKIAYLYYTNRQFERAIFTYNQAFEVAPKHSFWISHLYYQKAICYHAIQRHTDAYKFFKAFLRNPLNDRSKLRKSKEMVRQYELDQDNDGYLFYQEQENGTSDLEVDILSHGN